ncbi:MAG: DUF4372 domain-containing protein [Bradyrhizobium sp.]|nr:DUF4372 domain-containing protein [Pseudomonadota bacterium]MDE2068531.1 DUF4372 domain-containing protein [Bradyrhizobium sp.]MDE2243520.1 DUF4372 domain-containing protein [Bradyrhizobium sp.]
MPHHNTVFGDVLRLVPWHRFEGLVEEHDADARVRRLSTKAQFVALLYGQLSGASGLREIVTGLFEPYGAALSPRCSARSAVDLLGRQRQPTVCGVCRPAGPHDETGPSRTAPQTYRSGLSDRRHRWRRDACSECCGSIRKT